MFGSTSTSSKRKNSSEGVIEPDQRIVFAVLAVGMLVGALMTTPSKNNASAKLQPPAAGKVAHVTR